jgi:methionyl-tRNA formyltransferase
MEMNYMKIIIASTRKWNKNILSNIGENEEIIVEYIERKEQLTYDNVKQYSPKYIFFPHWSHIIPQDVYENFTCVVFHMTDLPFGRGGSPLQNLISRGIYKTKITALKCQKEIDSGDVYLKKELSLYGGAEEIYLRASKVIKIMILEILKKNIVPTKQYGEVVLFKRRNPEDGNMTDLHTLEECFDYIRMLDAEGYPKAFLNIGSIHLEFERASLRNGHIKADVKMTIREDKNE